MTSLSSPPSSSSCWSIAIKTVGNLNKKQDASPFSFSGMGGLKSPEGENDDDLASNGNGESSTFHLTVHPDDPLSSIGKQIHKLTGLEPTRQRLIYRGRILTVETDDDEDQENARNNENAAKANDTEDLGRLCPCRDIENIGLNDEQGSAGIANDLGSDASDPRANDDDENYTEERINDVIDSASPFASHDSHNSEEVDESVATRSDTMDLAEYVSLLRAEEANVAGEGGSATQPATLTSSLSVAVASPSSTSSTGDNVSCDANSNVCGNKTRHPDKVKRRKQRIRDVSGLCDGHTIHLVPRPDTAGNQARIPAGNANSSAATTSSTMLAETSPFFGLLGDLGTPTTTNTEGGTNITSISGPEGMHLLAALLGLSSNGGEEETTAGIGGGASGWLTAFEDTATTGIGTPTTAAASTNTPRATAQRDTETSLSRLANLSSNRRVMRRAGNGSSSARARAAAARLTEADIRARDPGSLEPVRQGLMTLHTLLGNALMNRPEEVKQEDNGGVSSNMEEDEVGEDEEEKMNSILEEEDQVLYPFPRPRLVNPANSTSQLQSHRQWYRGQWLDALDTVNQWLEATIVDIVLPSDILSTSTFNESTGTHISPSPRVKAKTRRRTPDAVVSANDLEGRRRLLLEPLPEDEVEEDSLANSDGMCSLLDEGYRQRDDNDGVQLLLIHYNGWPHRWDEWIRSDSERIRPFRTRTRHRTTSLLASPTPQNVFQAAPATHIMDEDDEVERASLLPELYRVLSSVNEVLSFSIPSDARHSPDDISPFAPSTDTAHLPWRLPNHGIATIFSSPTTDTSNVASPGRGSNPLSRLDSCQLRRLAPLIDRLGRTLTDAAPHIAALADSLPQPVVEVTNTPVNPFNLLEEVPGQSPAARVRAMNEWAMNIRSGGNSSNSNRVDNVDERSDDPDLSDFINGMVNTTRGVNRNDRDSNRDPLVSGLLSSYLSSQTGLGLGAGPDASTDADNPVGRLLRMGGGGGTTGGTGAAGGPGIDIHIHAVVTGPGMNNIGALGGLGMGTTATPLLSILRNGNSSTNSSATNRGGGTNPQIAGDQAGNEDDMDLFSELYSESPTPLNMHGPAAITYEDEAGCHEPNHVFEQCHSIDEESCSGHVLEVSSSDSNAHTSTADDEATDSPPIDPDVCEVKSSTEMPIITNNDEPNNNIGTLHAMTSLPSNNSIAQNSNGSIHTISEIDSASSPPSPTPSHRENVTSPSFTNRLYRRTFGRLSGSNSRHPNGSSP